MFLNSIFYVKNISCNKTKNKFSCIRINLKSVLIKYIIYPKDNSLFAIPFFIINGKKAVTGANTPEIEAALNTHPAVLNSAVVGRSIEGNEEIVAFVEPVPGCHIEIDTLFALLDEQLARYKKPQKIIVMSQLPVAPNGKIRKNDLKKYAEALPSFA